MSEEVNYKKNFCERYFDKGTWDLDVLHEVDVLLKDKQDRPILYIEAKWRITNENEHRRALAQTILTNKKQEAVLSHVALLYQDGDRHDVLEVIDCSENEVMYNNDFNWKAEKPSNPTRDAVDRINDRIQGRVTQFRDDEIREFYAAFKQGQNTTIDITERNFHVVYNAWRQAVHFYEAVLDEQELINLFLVDILNGTHYKKSFLTDIEDDTLFGAAKADGKAADTEQDLIREGTNLSQYYINHRDGKVHGFIYQGHPRSEYFTIDDADHYTFFWRKYRRPPEKGEFLIILERSATLYSDKYRRDTGGEYTPTCFVEKQNEILARHYNMDEFVVFDPCAGVGNLENQFGRDYKYNCFLSTLEQMDVDICKIKGFENVVRFDYLSQGQPRWKHKGFSSTIRDICRRDEKKLMVVMNPPYLRRKNFKYDLAIEFFRRVLGLEPDVIVYYCKTEFFLRDTISVFADSGYKVVSHIFSNAKETFNLSEWSISQVIFDRNNGAEITKEYVTADRYDFDRKTNKLNFVRSYTYDNVRPNLIKEIESCIKKNAYGLPLGQWTNQNYCLVISNQHTHNQYIKTGNLKYALLLKGLNFNTHGKYFETSNLTYRGWVKDISEELQNDAIMFSLFYKGLLFTNKSKDEDDNVIRNFIMPFTAAELGCARNDLNALYEEDILMAREEPAQGYFDFDKGIDDDIDEEGNEEELSNCVAEEALGYVAGERTIRRSNYFDFREFLAQFTFSEEAKALYLAALRVFRYYHSRPEYAAGRDWNDSFYDITNAIMGKDPATDYKDGKKTGDTRITRVKTTKGTSGFGRNTIRYAVPPEALPIFNDFFDARDTLARKINRQLVDSGLLLWERENIY